MSKRRKQKELFLDELAERPSRQKKERETRSVLDLLDELRKAPTPPHRQAFRDDDAGNRPR